MHTTAIFCRAVSVMVLLASGCGGRVAGSRTDGAGDRQTVEHQGRDRSYILRLPPSMSQVTDRVPLVIVLHGGGGNGANAEAMTGFTPKARSEGFIVVYPEGTARGRSRLLTWNAGHCCGYAMQARVDDVGFLRTLINYLSSQYPIDRNRIYVTGMSNGAMMSHRVGMELPDRVAAIAPVAGGVFGDEAAAAARVSAIMINGMLDRAVPYSGGEPGGRFAGSWDGTPVRPALDQTTFWAAANGCNTVAVTVDAGEYVHVRHECPVPLGVELFAVKDNGHAWPGGLPGSTLGDVPSRALNATDVIWGFFAAHPKP